MIFNSYSHEGLKLKNRIVMPGLSRCRADPATGVPSDIMSTFYSQRAQSAGVIITEFQPVNKIANSWQDQVLFGPMNVSKNGKKLCSKFTNTKLSSLLKSDMAEESRIQISLVEKHLCHPPLWQFRESNTPQLA